MQLKDWHYFDGTQWKGPCTRRELDDLHSSGVIAEHDQVIHRHMLSEGPMASGVPYSQLGSCSVQFDPSVETLLQRRSAAPMTVFSGPNNGGKSLLLKSLRALQGPDCYLIGCSRFYHVQQLNTRDRTGSDLGSYHTNFMHEFYTHRQNTETNVINLEQVITSLSNPLRAKLFDLCSDLLGNKFTLRRMDEDNDFSPFYVDMDGENLCFGSTGTRLLLFLMGICVDGRFNTILIDEPELGLSPKIQATTADFFSDIERRQEVLPHLKAVFVATHSHLFLDRRCLMNNFVVTKSDNQVSIEQVREVGDFHRLQFNMLGNDLESLFLPEAIVIAEGDSDVTFMTKAFQVFLPSVRITVVRAGGDGDAQNKLHTIKEAIGDISKSPYHNRIFVLLDQQHSVKTNRLVEQGVLQENVIVWSKNGIEYYYPAEIVCETFSCDEQQAQSAAIENDPIEINGIRKTKKELAGIVADKLSADSTRHEELERVLAKVQGVCGHG